MQGGKTTSLHKMLG